MSKYIRTPGKQLGVEPEFTCLSGRLDIFYKEPEALTEVHLMLRLRSLSSAPDRQLEFNPSDIVGKFDGCSDCLGLFLTNTAEGVQTEELLCSESYPWIRENRFIYSGFTCRNDELHSEGAFCI